MTVPSTVATALDAMPVAGRVGLEAGAGAGNATAGLLVEDAQGIYAVTNDPAHAVRVQERFDDDRLSVLLADLRNLAMTDRRASIVLAHGLFNVVPPADAAVIVAELDRVADPERARVARPRARSSPFYSCGG